MNLLPVPSLPKFDAHGRNILYLTFDDGPVPEVTPGVLHLLEKHGAQGTFFCLGRNITKNYALFKEIAARGHLVCNHSYSHNKGWDTPAEKYVNDVLRASVFFDNKFFRPPYGKISLKQYLMLKKTHRIVFWNVLSRDYDPALTWQECFRRVVAKSKAGSILVFHDSQKASERMLPCLEATLKYYGARNYVFRTLADA